MHRVRPGDRRGDRAGLSDRWLLVRGRGDRPLPQTGFTFERHTSTRRPTVAKGDFAICYASVWQAVYAVVKVTSDPEADPERQRWRWSFRIRPLVALDDWRHSYIRLSPEQFEAAREAIARRA